MNYGTGSTSCARRTGATLTATRTKLRKGYGTHTCRRGHEGFCLRRHDWSPLANRYLHARHLRAHRSRSRLMRELHERGADRPEAASDALARVYPPNEILALANRADVTTSG